MPLPLDPAYCKLSLDLVSGFNWLIPSSPYFTSLQPYLATMVTIESGPERKELGAELRVQHFSILGFVRNHWIVDISSMFPCSPCLPLLYFVLVLLPLVEAMLLLAVFSSLVVSYSQSCRITALLKYLLFLLLLISGAVFVRIVDNETVS